MQFVLSNSSWAEKSKTSVSGFKSLTVIIAIFLACLIANNNEIVHVFVSSTTIFSNLSFTSACTVLYLFIVPYMNKSG